MASVVCDDSGACNTSQAPTMFEVDKEFILTYESLPELWNTTDLRYTNKAIRTKALEKLLVIYQRLKPFATIEDVRKKINSLRSNYRRELNKVLASERSGAPEVYRSKAWYFPYLNFFRKLEQPEYKNELPTSPTVDTEEEETQTQEDEKTVRYESPKTEPLPPKEPSKSKGKIMQNLPRDRQYKPYDPRPQCRPSNPIALEWGDTVERLDAMQGLPPKGETTPPKESFKNKGNVTQNFRQERQYKPYQQHHQCQFSNPIALEWASTLERLDPMQKLYAKKAINDILFEAELGNLHKHSVTINEPYSHYLPTSSAVLSSSVISPHHPPSPTQQADPISVVHDAKDESSSDVEYKVSITQYEN